MNEQNNLPGTARLIVVVPVALMCFFYISMLDYAVPLYFGALSERDATFPADVWSKVVLYQVVPWIIGPVLAGLLARRYGERIVWSVSLLGKVCVPLILCIYPNPNIFKALTFWQGFTGTLIRQSMRWSHAGYLSEHIGLFLFDRQHPIRQEET